jgi:peptidoglycan/xylan/chitin deacetylase (PgdA/CDA1 family)
VRDVLVLCYHAVSDDWPAMLALPGERLERQLTHLVERGYRGATFTEAVHDPPAPRTVAVTFDDGFRSVIDRALPILERLGLPGTLFAPTAHIGQPGPRTWPGTDRWLGTPHEHELAAMTWDDLGALVNAGWEIGSHTRTHPRLTELAGEPLARELAASRDDCRQRLGRPCESLAYPYGDVDRRVARAAREAGYTAAAGLPERLDRRRAMCWPRVGIYRNDLFPRFEAKVGRARRHLIGWAAGEWMVRESIRRRAGG